MNLLELARAAPTDEHTAALAATLGESVGGTRSGLHSVAIPAVLAGLIRQYGRDAATGGLLADLLRDGGYASLLPQLGPALAGGVVTDTLTQRGEGLHGLLFDGRADQIAELLTQATGLRPTSSRRLLGLAVPIVLAAVARACEAVDEGTRGAWLAAQLRDLAEPLASAAPAGLAAALGTRDFAPLDLPPPRKPALWPWLLVPAITLALFFLLRWVQQSSMVAP